MQFIHRLMWSATLLAALPFASFSSEIIVKNTEVKSVKLYRTGAEVTRNISVSVSAGNSTLLLKELSPYLDPSTISVRGMAAGKTVILGVSHRYDYTGPEKLLPEVGLLQDSLEILTRQRSKVTSQLAVCQEEQNLLLANKQVGGANTGLKTEDLRSMAVFYRERLTELKDKSLELTEREKKLTKEITKIQQQIEELKNRRNPPSNSSTVLIDISCAAEARISFDITYMTSNASWSPQYDVLVTSLVNPVNLLLKAQVRQDTWEVWDNVKVIISTGNISAGNTKPELFPWYLNFQQPVVMYDSQMNAPAAAQTPAVEKRLQEISGLQQVEYASEYVTSEQTGFATEYAIGLPYSIPSDGKQHSVEVQTIQLPASYKYHVVPKLDTDVFLVAHVTGWQDQSLLSGPTKIYYEGSYVGTSYLNTRETADTLLVSLGRDPRIVVSREKLKDVEGNKLIGGNRVKEYRFEITVKNTRKEAIALFVWDQIPVSMDKDIEVKTLELSGAELETATGELKWKLEIAPSAQTKKELGFSVKYPKDKLVDNL